MIFVARETETRKSFMTSTSYDAIIIGSGAGELLYVLKSGFS